MSNDIECYRCNTPLDAQSDEWWSHSWEEHPSEENVEKALEDKEFRDWFRENKVLCPDCHKVVVEVFRED